MRVMFLITDLELGGSPLMLRGLARGLLALGVEPVVVSITPAGQVGDMMRADGVRVMSLGAMHVSELGDAVRHWIGLVKEVQPDLVCSILIHANVVATLARAFAGDALRMPHVQSIHTLQKKPAWHWWAQGLVGRWAEAVVVPTAAILRRMEGYGTFKGGTVISNGVDLRRFKDAVAINSTLRGFDPQRRVIGYIGRFDRVKRLETLVDAVASIKNHNPLLYNRLQLVLVGYGEEEQALRERVLKWGLYDHVTFTGPVTAPEHWYKCFDCCCLPSDAEGFGLTLVEAMAAGIPVVAAKTDVSMDILHLYGSFFPVGDCEALAVVLQEVIAKMEVIPEFGQVPMGELERFSEEKMARGYFIFFQDLLKSDTTNTGGVSG